MKNFHLYAFDAVPHSGCILSEEEDTSNILGFKLDSISDNLNDEFVLVSISKSISVSKGDMLISPIVMTLLGYNHGFTYNVEPVSLESILSLAALALAAERVDVKDKFVVNLLYKGFKSIKNWDDLPSGEGTEIILPNAWCSGWIPGMHIKTINNQIAIFLENTILSNGSLVLIPILDEVALFKIAIPLIPSGYMKASKSLLSYMITNYGSDQPNSPSSSSSLEKSKLLFNLQDFDYTMDITHRVCNWFSVHLDLNMQDLPFASSILLQGPKGSGKSYILLMLQKFYQQKANVLLETYAIDCKSLKSISSETFQAVKDESDPCKLLTVLLSISGAKYSANISNNAKVLLIIDNLEEVMNLFIVSNDFSGKSQAENIGKEMKLKFSFLLNRFLQLANTSDAMHVLILGACNLPISQLPRRSLGCPEFELAVSLLKPSKSDRAKIVANILSQIEDKKLEDLSELDTCSIENLFPDDLDVSQILKSWSNRIAAATKGYLPWDLKSCIQTCYDSSLNSSCLEWKNMIQAVDSGLPRGLQDFDLELRQDIGRDIKNVEFAGYERKLEPFWRVLKAFKNDHTKSPLRDVVRSLSKGFVIYGPSGCGKSLLIKLMAKELQLNLVTIRCSDILSKYFGETESKIRKLFQTARTAAPCLLHFDNFDSLAHRRSDSEEAESSHGSIGNRILSTFLNELDGVSSINQKQSSDFAESLVLVVASSSSLDCLDEALIRPGRLQHHVNLDYPDREDVRKILEYYLREEVLSSSASIDQIVTLICSYSNVTGALIEDICNKARENAVDELSGNTETDYNIFASWNDLVATKGKTIPNNVILTSNNFEVACRSALQRVDPFNAGKADWTFSIGTST